MSERRARLAIGAAIVLGVALRLLVLPAKGFPSDVFTFMAWAERLATIGPAEFYAPGYFSDYPPGYLYVLWLLGALFDGEALRLAVKATSIPADAAIALTLAALAWRSGGPAAATLASALWMLQPAPIFAGPYWGQVDAVGTLPFLLALLAAGRRRWLLAGALGALAAMVKPQFGLALLVVAVAAGVEFVRLADRRPILKVSSAALAVVAALALPFRLGPGELAALVRSAAETYPFTSLFAFNAWSIVGDFWQPDDAYVVAGGVLLAAGLVGACAALWWRRDTAMLLAAGALAAMAFYFLPTRAHERYLFPALALLLPLAVARSRLFVPYVALALAFFASLYFAFTRYPQNDLAAPALLEATVFARPGQIALALLLLALAAYLTWRLLTGEASLAPTLDPRRVRLRGLAGRWSLPPGLRPGYAPRRRDLAVALAVALAVLATRGYRLDDPRDMYFDEVYHARTAFELLARREPYEWTHPHLAKELMALGILVFANDRVVGTERAPRQNVIAFAADNDGDRAYATAFMLTHAARGGSGGRGDMALGVLGLRAMVLDGSRVFYATDSELFEVPVPEPPGEHVIPRARLPFTGSVTSLALSRGRIVVAGTGGAAIYPAIDLPPVVVRTPAVAVTAKPDGTELYLLDPQGTVHVVDPSTGGTLRSFSGPAGSSLAYVEAPKRLFVARADTPALDVIEIEGGRRETVPLGNARTGSFRSGATALAVVPRTQFVYALADGRVVVVEPHGASPFSAIPVKGSLLAIDGTADELLVAGSEGVERIPTGRYALAWRLPGVVLAALLAFFLVLLARRLFASALLPALVGAIVLLDGSMFAQARIGMNDVYVAAFLVMGWYFVVASHRPRRSAAVDLLLAGACFGAALASKWVAAYALAGVLVAAVAVTARAYERGQPGRGGPLDLLARRGANAAFLFLAFAVVPAALYLAAYVPWFGGPMTPFGWDLAETTRQMYWYHSGLTAPHPAGSPWWSWPLVLKPVYWYYAQSGAADSAVIYDSGNVVLYWGALAAFAWCALASLRARSVALGFVVFALLVQFIAWIPITRVLFFYHFFAALPFYFIALGTGLVALRESGRGALVAAYLALAAAAFAFFYPFVSGVPVPASQSAVFFILPTWQYDCQFYPAFRCAVTGGASLAPELVLARLVPAALVAALVAGLAYLAASGRLRARLSGPRAEREGPRS